MPPTVDEVWRDYVVEGNPSSGAHEPIKSEIRDVLGGHEDQLALAVRKFATRTAAVAADLSDLAVGDIVQTVNYASSGDGGGGFYVRTASLFDATVGSFTAADGSFWKLLGPVVNILQFGAAADSTATGLVLSTSAINACIAFVNANSAVTTIIFGRGEVYTVDGQLTAFTRPIEILGAVSPSASPSILNKRFVEASATRGLLAFTTFLPAIRYLSILATSGSGGSAISIINPTDQASAGRLYLEDLNVSTGDFCNYGLYFDGTANDVAPLGCRNLFLSRVQVFGAALWAAKWNGVHNVFCDGVTIDSTGGSGGALWVTGTVAVTSDNIVFAGIIAGSTLDRINNMHFVGATGNLTIDNSAGIHIYGQVGGTIANTSNVTNSRIFGRVTGTVQTNWDHSNKIVGNTEDNGARTFRATVNFNSANTDTEIAIELPPGYTRYKVESVIISKASQTLTTATCGLFTAAAGGGTAIVAGASAITVSTASDNTNNNMQTLTVANQATLSITHVGPLYFRVGTAQGAAATGVVAVTIRPVG